MLFVLHFILISKTTVQKDVFHDNNYNAIYIILTLCILTFFLYKMHQTAKANKVE